MSYAAVVTTKNLLGGKWLIRVSETGGTSAGSKIIALADPQGDASALALPFNTFQLVQVQTQLVSGDGGTLLPKLQRRLDDGVTYATMFLAGDAVAENVWTFDPLVEIRTTHLKHFSQPASGTNNVAWTEYIVRRMD